MNSVCPVFVLEALGNFVKSLTTVGTPMMILYLTALAEVTGGNVLDFIYIKPNDVILVG